MPGKHKIKNGDCLTSIARQHGLAGYEVVRDYPDNAGLQQARPNPNLLFPGDEVAVPHLRSKEIKIETGKRHVFTLERPQKWLRLRLLDSLGNALANEPYILRFDNSVLIEGQQTDADGCIEQRVEPPAKTAFLDVAGRVWQLRLGWLNPIADTPDHGVSGAKARLQNLGYYRGPVDDVSGPSLHIALALFQADHDLEVQGELDDETIAKLIEVHGF